MMCSTTIKGQEQLLSGHGQTRLGSQSGHLWSFYFQIRSWVEDAKNHLRGGEGEMRDVCKMTKLHPPC